MVLKTQSIKKQLSLLISIIIVIPIGIIYGFKPDVFFDIHLNTIDEHHVFKAIAGFYLTIAMLWIVGIYNRKYWEIAIVSNFIFMFGLAFGRIVSLFCDGMPSLLFVFGILGELILGIYSLYVWRSNAI